MYEEDEVRVDAPIQAYLWERGVIALIKKKSDVAIWTVAGEAYTRSSC